MVREKGKLTTSTTPPPVPGGSCPTATVLCDKNPFTLNTFPGNVAALQPSCFGNTFQDPVFYQFTCGQTGTCEWTAQPIGSFTELDWVMYDITTGCPDNTTPELACNFFYANESGAPAGMSSTVLTANCPITNGFGPNTYEYCTPATLTAGRKYLLIIDNYSNISGETAGFDLTWGGTFTIAPTSQFTANPTSSCAPPLNVSFINNSTVAVSYNWNFGNGNSSAVANPAPQTYTTPGVYLVSLAATSNTGCVDISTQTITVGEPPVVTVPTNTTVCAGATIPAAVFTSVPSGATFTWTNSNTAIGLGASGSANIPSFTATNSTAVAITATITVTPTLNGCVGAPSSYTITVDPTPTLSAITSQTVCNGDNTTAINFTVNPPASSIDWTNSNTSIGIGASGSGNIASFVGTNAGSASILGNFVATPTFNGCTGAPQNFSITVNPIPSIPAVSNQTICAGANTTAINFNPTPVTATVNWTNSNNTIGIGLSGSGNIAAFTGTNAGSTPQTGNFVATPVLNGCTGTAQNFSITVDPTPSISVITNQTVCAGANTTAINFNPTPATTTVNWTNSNSTIGLGTSGSGDISAFTGTNAGSTPQTGNFVATPTLNGCTGTAQNFSITIDPIPSIPAVSDQTICAGANTTAINFNPTPATTTINWTNSNSTIGIGAMGSGNIAAFLGINTSSTPQTGNFAATPVLNGCIGTTQNFSINVNPLPTILAVPNDTVCSGFNTSGVNFVSTPATATVNWTNSDPAIGIGVSGTGNIPPFLGTNSGTTILTGNFVATPVLNGCTGTSQNFSIVVRPGVVVNSISDITVCNTINIPASSFSSTPAGATFSWTNDNSSIGLASNGTGDYSQFNAINTTTSPLVAQVSVIATLNTCVSPPQTFTITVNPTPAPPVVNPISYCVGDVASPLTATGSNIIWYTSPGLANPQPSITPGTTVADTGTTNYYATQTVLNCLSPVAQLPVTVKPLPSITQPSDITVCAGANVPVTNFSSTPAGASYTWVNNNTSIGLAATGSNAVPTFVSSNTGTITVSAAVTVTPILAGCVGPTITYNINVLPLPSLSQSDITVCANEIVATTNFISTPPGATYTWTNNNGSIGLITFGSGDVPSFTATNSSSVIETASITVTPVLNSCSGSSTSYLITVKPLPSAPLTTPISFCKDENTISLINNATPSMNGTLNWYGTVATGGVASPLAPTPSSAIAPSTTSYYVSQTVDGCEGPRGIINVIINPLPTATINTANPGCAPITRDFFLTSTSNLVTYFWNMGNGIVPFPSNNDSIIQHPYDIPGTYDISIALTDINGCKDTARFNSWVVVYEIPEAEFAYGPTTVSILEPEVNFTNLSVGTNIISHFWEFGDPKNNMSSLTNPTFTYQDTGTYNVTLTVVNGNGCIDSVTHPVVIPQDWAIYVPNAFSPNDDGINDFFHPKGVGIDEKTYNIWIFDRWGNLVFHTQDWYTYWDGKVQGGSNVTQEDTYVWKITVKNFKGKKFSDVGHVNVVR